MVGKEWSPHFRGVLRERGSTVLTEPMFLLMIEVSEGSMTK